MADLPDEIKDRLKRLIDTRLADIGDDLSNLSGNVTALQARCDQLAAELTEELGQVAPLPGPITLTVLAPGKIAVGFTINRRPDDPVPLPGRPAWRCDCHDSDLPEYVDTPHLRERVPDAPVEVCYIADHETETITVLKIRTMDE